MYATLSGHATERQVEAWLETRNGRRIDLGPAVLGGAATAWGSEIPIDLQQVRSITFETPDGGTAFRGQLGSPSAVVSGWTPPAR